jgi:hypothetical protein
MELGEMRIQFSFRTPSIWQLATLLFLTGTFGGNAFGQTTRPYLLTFELSLDVESGGEKVKMGATGEAGYVWNLKEPTVRLASMDSLHMKMLVNSAPYKETTITRDRYVDITNGKREEQARADASETMERFYVEYFDRPHCKVELDAQGREKSRKIIASDYVKSKMGTGMASNVFFFHPPPPPGDAWESDAALEGGGKGNLFRGKIRYRLKSHEGNKQVYEAAGELKIAPEDGAAGESKSSGDMKITGEHVYDADQKEWISGAFMTQLSIDAVEGNVTAKSKGTMKLNFHSRSEKAGK